jgi:hypothetical protein
MNQDSYIDWSKLSVKGALGLNTHPKIVGYWVLYPDAPGIKFAMYSKPTAEQITNTEQLLGWGWEDA